MKKNVLEINETAIERELKKIETSAQKFQPLLDAMVLYGYEPTEKEFREIVTGRNQKNPLPIEDFLRVKTVKKYPSIDSLPITQFMKKTMIELPLECEALINMVYSLPSQLSVLNEVYKMELKDGKLVVSETAKQAIIDSHTIYANERENDAFIKANEALESLIELQENFGINFFQQNLIQCNTPGNLKGASLKAESVKYAVSQFAKHK